jgi:hypothetical protein
VPDVPGTGQRTEPTRNGARRGRRRPSHSGWEPGPGGPGPGVPVCRLRLPARNLKTRTSPRGREDAACQWTGFEIDLQYHLLL